MENLYPVPRKGTGFGKVVSLAHFIALFTVFPEFIKLLWPTILDHLSQPFLYLAVLVVTSFCVLAPYNFVMYFIYRMKIPFFQSYRCDQRAWPWQSDYEKWSQLFKKTIRTVLFNLFILNISLPIYEYYVPGIKYRAGMEDWPTAFTIFWQFILFVFVEDTLFYWSHYSLHNPKLYWIHKQHHEYTNTLTITSTYSHPLQYIFSNMLPTGISYHLLAKVTSVHYVTIIVWLTFRLLETCDGHSGYEWSWGQMAFNPWKLSPEYHSFHHSKNVGNFGSMFGFWDTVMGTNKTYKQMLEKQKSK